MFNETISTAASVINVTTHYVTDDLYPRGFAIIDAPLKTPEMLWMLVPIIASGILMEFYFGRYKEEELGWNTAFGNSLVLTFVSIDLFRHTYEPTGMTILESLQGPDGKITIAMMLFGFAILLVLMDYFHFLPKKLAYAISSSSFVHMIALLGIVIVYSDNIPLEWTTLLACFLLFLFANFILHIIYWIVPSYRPPLHRIINVDRLERLTSKNRDD